MEFLTVIVLTILEVWLLRNTYIAWFRPQEYFKMVNKQRQRAGNIFPFILKIWTVRLITDHSKADLWGARLVSLFIVLVSTLVLTTLIFSIAIGGVK
jgi:hypothetical protein